MPNKRDNKRRDTKEYQNNGIYADCRHTHFNKGGKQAQLKVGLILPVIASRLS